MKASGSTESGGERRQQAAAYDGAASQRDPHYFLEILNEVRALERYSPHDLERIIRSQHRKDKELVSIPRTHLLAAYRQLCAQGVLPFEPEMVRRLQRKPIRTISGVAPVTVLTKPFPCPGRCIFCPTREGMPQSYLPDEPGARRAASHDFDPYDQTAGRLQVLETIGHATGKVELLILGGTWSSYPHDYQEWFIRRCLEAMNGEASETLADAQQTNETATHRNVGLVIETRPDAITAEEVRRLRWLGVTKVQLGVQSLDDAILAQNKRGHSVEQIRQAMRLLRLAGFKIALHWMPNLLGATPESDLQDFRRLWDDPTLRPDELKIYPCLLLTETKLHTIWQQGLYQPYSEEVLTDLLARCKTTIPIYSRINRLMRDIPSPNVVAGVRRTNLRQLVQNRMAAQGLACQCIRCREVRGQKVDPEALQLEQLFYETDATREYFLSYVTTAGKLAGFLRLSLPREGAQSAIEEVRGCAMIREVHVYGPALDIAAASEGQAQHLGLGSRLVEEAGRIARQQGFQRLAVIAAVGTRQYYGRRGFQLTGSYMVRVF